MHASNAQLTTTSRSSTSNAAAPIEFIRSKETTQQEDLVHLNNILESLDPKSRIALIVKLFQDRVVAATSAGIGSRVLPQLFHEIQEEGDLITSLGDIKKIPFVFLDTGDLFDQTLNYAKSTQEDLGLNFKRVAHKLTPEQFLARSTELIAEGYSHNDVFDQITKVQVLKAVIDKPSSIGLKQISALIAGNRRSDSAARQHLPFIEKKNGIFYAYPLADLDDQQIDRFFVTRQIDDHPLKSLGYASLGNRYDTRVKKTEDKDVTAGRHGGVKTECGFHTAWLSSNAEITVLKDWNQRVISPRVVAPRILKSTPLENHSSLNILESETSHILLETVASYDRVALMFSAGKDSACIAHIAQKLFKRSDGKIAIPFEFFQYDSGDNFVEVLEFRDRVARNLGVELKIFEVDEAYKSKKITAAPDDQGSIHALVELINYSQRHHSVEALIGGGRRDEDPVRAKERIFSLRDVDGKWQPHNQRPEVWNNYNTQITSGQHMRVFPISNWTEQNIWEYIVQDKIELPSIYYAHERQVFLRDGGYLAYFEDTELREGEKVELKTVRCRSVGDRKTTGFFESNAATPEEVLEELIKSEYSERSGRAEDVCKKTAMESRKEDGWF